MKAELKHGLTQRDLQISCWCFRPSRRSQQRPKAPLPSPVRVATAPVSHYLIPASAGGKLRVEIGVVPPVSNTAVVLDCLNGPLPTLCALTLGDLGLSVLSPSQSASQERCLANWSRFFSVSMMSTFLHCWLVTMFTWLRDQVRQLWVFIKFCIRNIQSSVEFSRPLFVQ